MARLPRLLCFLLTFSFLVPAVEGMSFMQQKFDWLPSESAHKKYPMRLIKGDLVLNDGSTLYVPARSIIDNGWGEIGSTHAVGSKMKALPVRLTATWFSFAEDKFYFGDFVLPYDRILSLFRKGTISPSSEKRVSYDRITIGFGPEGAISVWLHADGEVILVGNYNAKEAFLDWKAVLDNSSVTRKDFINSVLKDSLTETEYAALKEHGVPSGTADLFNRKYRWNLSVVGGDRQKVLVKCANGEAEFFDFVETDNVRTHRALPKELKVRWGDPTGKRHMTQVTFDESEIAGAFKRLSGGKTEHPIQLHVDVGAPPGVLEASVRDSKFIIRLQKLSIKRFKLKDTAGVMP